MHGGHALSGPANPNYKDGRYSKVMPKRLMDTYLRAANDGDLLVLRDEVAVVDARLADLLGRLDSGESGAAWRKALEQYAALQEAIDAGDPAALKSALDSLGSVIRRGLADYAAWGEVLVTLDARRKLVESERKRLVQLSQMITAEQAMVLVTAVISLVKDNVDDQRALARISDGLRRLTSSDR
jgi:hypothetical protein